MHCTGNYQIMNKALKSSLLIMIMLLTGWMSFAQNPNPECTKIVASDRSLYDEVGWSCAMDGNRAMMGSRNCKQMYKHNILGDMGAVYFYEKTNSGKWTEVQKVQSDDTVYGIIFGTSVSMCKDFAIIGARGEREATDMGYLGCRGSAYIYQCQADGKWTKVQKLMLPKGKRAEGDYFGEKVCITEKYAVVCAWQKSLGASFLSGQNGAVYVFKKGADGKFGDMKDILPEDKTTRDFGGAISVCGNRIVISAAGYVCIYELNGTGEWKLVQKLNNPFPAIGGFGSAVACSNDCVVVCAYGVVETGHIPNTKMVVTWDSTHKYESAGVAYVYRKTNGSWQIKQTLQAKDRMHHAYFGMAASMNDSILAITAFGDRVTESNDENLQYVGAAYIFKLDKGGSWYEYKKIMPIVRRPWLKFGFSVCVSGLSAIIGCRFDDRDAQGANPIERAGSAYIYEPKRH